MSYIYTEVNRLEQPHNYMYAPFDGERFLHAYQISRMNTLRGITSVNSEAIVVSYEQQALQVLVAAMQTPSFDAAGKVATRFDGYESFAIGEAEEKNLQSVAAALLQLTPTASVDTRALLESLIAAELREEHAELACVWLDRLIQRFEVTKKIYEAYQPGFRKGESSNHSIILYWQMALVLSLSYARTQHLKYLNTLLKVCDLLCSLPQEVLFGHLPAKLMSAILMFEVDSVSSLAQTKGVNIATQ
jgi:hypothetical protein